MSGAKGKGTFRCSRCHLSCRFDYFGQRPPFQTALILLEDAYVMKDPFSPDERQLVLGSHCSVCQQPVCVGTGCSVFYTKRFCLPCVLAKADEFPEEIRKEVESKNTEDIQRFE
ncbi:cysteine-rich DPF motif domain-containing protein 1-like [Corticium candelabrum]|uniref:cysteine-rich DPF motif domain-containing protein 1-like n=1 Tax=Corticium candelabrum TaxID=121492 RepID=UPI002E271F07|nr:cysteine-rich DPF motif domain-containing protein 1-like [Corticium candelabrum]